MAKKNLSALKRVRQNKKRRMRNKMIKSELKTYFKKTKKLISEKEIAGAIELMKKYFSKIDKAVKRNIVHQNYANRKKSTLSRLLNILKSNSIGT